MTLAEIVNDVWRDLKRKRLIPLSKPVLSQEIDTAAIDFLRQKTIFINPNFASKVSKTGNLPVEDVVYAMLRHETEHYFFLPHDLPTLVYQHAVLKDTSEGKRRVIINFYNDIAVNLNITVQNAEEGRLLASLYANMPDKDTPMGKLIRVLYNYFTGLDFGAKEEDLTNDLKSKLNRLKMMDFFVKDKNAMAENLTIFASVISDLINQNEQRSEREEIIFKGLSSEEADKALRELSNVLDKDDYVFAYDFVKRQVYDVKKNKDEECEEEPAYGTEEGYKRKESEAIYSWYVNRSKNYKISIIGNPLSVHGYGKGDRKPWVPSDSPRYIDVKRGPFPFWKTWKKEELKGYDKIKIPDALIIIDSSGSMNDPQRSISYAVLAAMAAARQYMRNGAKVDVINFSVEEIITRYRDEDSVYRAIFHYQGEGTIFPTNAILNEIESSKDKKDIIIITDGEVPKNEAINLFDALEKHAKENRVIFIHIDTAGNAKTYKKYTQSYRQIRFEFISREEDIPEIIIRDTSYYQSLK
jgi:hypothetical protein